MSDLDLDAIRARLAAYANDLAECPDGHEYVIGTGWRFLYPNAPADVRALLAEVERLRGELGRIEHDARLSANPARAHSAHISYEELLGGYSVIADIASRALENATP